MKQTAKKLLDLPMKNGELDDLITLQDANGANITLEQALMLRQIQAATAGDTEAALFIQQVIGEEESVSDDTAIQDAAAEGDSYAMLCAMRDKLATLADKTLDPREYTSLTRQLMEVNDRIDQINKNKANKEGDNPLNVIALNISQKRRRKVANG